ncbi:hypothetical protein JCM6882_003461 [Rhodosporidiobolus microsporus]
MVTPSASQQLEGEKSDGAFSTRPPTLENQEHVDRRVSVRQTLVLAALSLGVIYGDIGTSTLYSINGIFPASGPLPSREDIVGGCSAIIWAIIIVPVVKYCLIALHFGTGEGEGGPFAIYTTLFPSRTGGKEDGGRSLTGYTNGAPSTAPKTRSLLHRRVPKFSLFVLVLLGVSLTIADGMLTPAVSVVSAVGGIAFAVPRVSDSSSIVGISCAILFLLFVGQALGTKRIATLFSPIVAVWLALNGIGGAINIAQHPSIFRAFDPSRAVMLFVRTGNYDLLNGVILAITGVEALFANLGQFSKNSIRLAFVGYAAPCLILQYLGQGAKLITGGEEIFPNIFFHSIPGGVGKPFWWVTWIFAVLAAVIASQAMITATFSLVQQLTQLNVIPPLRIIHTDNATRGRIYIPMVNFLLFIGTIGLTCGFGTGAGLSAAYGFAVSGVLLITTTMIALAMVELKHLPILLAVGYFLGSGFIDGLFIGATAKKVPHGAWFPLGLACILLILLLLWSWAKGLEDRFDRDHRCTLSSIMRRTPGADVDVDEKVELAGEGDIALAETETNRRSSKMDLPSYEMTGGGASLARPHVFALFHNLSSVACDGAPHAFAAFLRSYPALPEIIVFLTLRTVNVPHVPAPERFLVERQRNYQGVYTATVSFGYRDAVDLSDVAAPLRNCIVALETRSATGPEELRELVQKVDAAVAGAVTHILPRFHVAADQSPSRSKLLRLVRTFLLEEVYRRVAVNFDPTDQYIFGAEAEVLRMSVTAVL